MTDKNFIITASVIDFELEEVIQKRISSTVSKIIVVGSGITSSHLGDERNLREFLIANSVSNYLREKGKNTLFLLFDDSYDPLNFRQLRVAVNKDEKLIKKFEKYCGVPIKLIPDPYECHPNYSAHYQTEILERFYSLDMYPVLVDSYFSYESGLYDFAKEIVFTKYAEIEKFLKKEFPQYTMKKIFYPVCPKCSKIEDVGIERISRGNVSIKCLNCQISSTSPWKDIKGKFSWKIDAAVKWNVFKTDFEAFSKAYLDPDVGSYFIAKKLSENFFGGYYPEIIHYGQIIMDKSLSYKLLASFPKDIFHSIFLTHRKKDMVLSDEKIIQFARDYKIDSKISYHDYIVSKLPHDLFASLYRNEVDPKYKKFMDHGLEFARHFLKKELSLKLPEKEIVKSIDKKILLQIKKLIEWIISYKLDHIDDSIKTFSENTALFLAKNKMHRTELFSTMRKLLAQEDSLPMNKILYFAPNTFLYECVLIIVQVLFEIKGEVFQKSLNQDIS